MLVEAREIRKNYRVGGETVEVLRGVSLDLKEGETLALTGESGSGKSTLLHLLAALDSPDDGTITLDGVFLQNLDEAGRARQRRKTVGLVFQQFNLIPSLNVSANLAFQARLADRHDAAWHAEVAERLGLTAHLRRFPEQLSGGQQQRVAIVLARASLPRVRIADEPSGNLDDANADAEMVLMLSLVQETRAGLLMVTHSAHLAGRLSRRQHLKNGRLT